MVLLLTYKFCCPLWSPLDDLLNPPTTATAFPVNGQFLQMWMHMWELLYGGVCLFHSNLEHVTFSSSIHKYQPVSMHPFFYWIFY